MPTGTFTRSGVGSYFDYAGVLQSAATNTPRFTFNPNNLAAGAVLLNEAAATNVLLNSATVATQTITTSAATYTLSFYGTGSVTLSGASTGVLTGTGTLARVSLTFVATAGSTTLTVSGVATNGQLEVGSTATSIIPTTGTAVTRNAETNTQLMTSDVPETDATAWNSGTTYPLGALAFDPVSRHIFSSTGVTALPNMLANAGIVLSQSIVVAAGSCSLSFYGTGSITLSGTATGTLAGTGVANQVQLTVTAAAGTVILAVTGSCTTGVFKNGTAVTNTNNPIPNTTWWIDAGADNLYRLFDDVCNQQCTQANNFNVALTPNTRFDSVAGFNCNASSAVVTVVDPTYGVVYNKTTSLVTLAGIHDMYAYLYEPIEYVTEFAVTDIPLGYSTATVTVSFLGAEAACGELVIGLSKELGYTDWTATSSIVDYSIKTQDAFGNYTIVPRTFQKENVYTVQVDNTQVDAVFNLLAGYRATPIVYLGSNASVPNGQPTPTQYSQFQIFGFYKTCSIAITYEAFSTMSVEIEGLT